MRLCACLQEGLGDRDRMGARWIIGWMVREAQQPAWLVRENERARVRQKARVREVWVYRQVT